MQPYQQRVVDEKTELDEKLIKLKSFLKIDMFRNLNADEQERLRRQRNIMQEYSDILKQRIDAFE